MIKFNPIYGLNYAGFGDQWASMNWLLRYVDSPMLSTIGMDGHNYNKTLTEIIDSLDTDKKVIFSSSKAHCVIKIKDGFGCNYLNTKTKWVGDKKLICVQFDGKSQQELKNLDVNEELRLLKFLSNNYEVIDVGKRMPLMHVIENLSRASAFVGVPSGISHVARSVGLPIVLICQDKLEKHINIKNKMDVKSYFKIIYGNTDVLIYNNVDLLINHKNFLFDFHFNKNRLINLTDKPIFRLL